MTSYRDSTEIAGIGVGATLLRKGEIKQRFITDLEGEFIVVEVALFPESGVEFEVLPEKFGIRIDGGRTARPENPKVIAGRFLQPACCRPPLFPRRKQGRQRLQDPVRAGR